MSCFWCHAAACWLVSAVAGAMRRPASCQHLLQAPCSGMMGCVVVAVAMAAAASAIKGWAWAALTLWPC
eukprot:364247-Chlamydomonas_euryale.AAC.1